MKLNLLNKRFGKLLVINTVETNEKGGTRFVCLCDCGKQKIVLGKQLNQGCHKSCGCSQFKIKTSDHPLYTTWKGIRERCNYKKAPMYPHYGGKGVRVCSEWQKSFTSFRDWALLKGWKEGLQIDKDIIPKNLGIPALLYSPEFCSIVSRQENVYNSSVAKLTKEQVLEIRNSSISYKEAEIKYGINNTTFYSIKNRKTWLHI